MWIDKAFPVLRRALFKLDAECAHTLTIRALRTKIFPRCTPEIDDPILKSNLWGQDFQNPIGLAAGFDKNAEIISPMLGFGFGFVEVGTITPKPQAGNPRPRVFRDPQSRSIINRMGFPGAGLSIAKRNLEDFLAQRPRPMGIIGINIGMNKDQSDPLRDYALLLRQLGGLADYVTVNISSPNTPGLRDLQHEDHLKNLLSGLMEERTKFFGENPPPILVKLSPDLDDAQISPIAKILLDQKIDGIILANTTLARPTSLPDLFAVEKGGLSGPHLQNKSTAIISRFFTETNGRIPIIGVGGIASAHDAFEKICAGASLIQLYTALVYEGPGLIGRIKAGLAALLRENNFTSITQAVGTNCAKGFS